VTASTVLTVRDAQILQLLREGVTRQRVLHIGLYRRSWTAADIQRVVTHWLPDGTARPLTVVRDEPAIPAPRKPPRTPGQLTPGLRDMLINLLDDPAVTARLRAILQPPAEPAAEVEGRAVTVAPRLLAIAAGICDGLPNKAIGARLHITEDTVKTHLRRLFTVLGVRDRTSAAVLLASGQVRLVAKQPKGAQQ
jgi:DNA-binding CsgD family transcriptional regulator